MFRVGTMTEIEMDGVPSSNLINEIEDFNEQNIFDIGNENRNMNIVLTMIMQKMISFATTIFLIFWSSIFTYFIFNYFILPYIILLFILIYLLLMVNIGERDDIFQYQHYFTILVLVLYSMIYTHIQNTKLIIINK